MCDRDLKHEHTGLTHRDVKTLCLNTYMQLLLLVHDCSCCRIRKPFKQNGCHWMKHEMKAMGKYAVILVIVRLHVRCCVTFTGPSC